MSSPVNAFYCIVLTASTTTNSIELHHGWMNPRFQNILIPRSLQITAPWWVRLIRVRSRVWITITPLFHNHENYRFSIFYLVFSVNSYHILIHLNHRVTSEIRYKKTPWGLIKNFIEKNVNSGLSDNFKKLGEDFQYFLVHTCMNVWPSDDFKSSVSLPIKLFFCWTELQLQERVQYEKQCQNMEPEKKRSKYIF